MRLTCLLLLLTLRPARGDDDDGGGSDATVVDARANGADASGPVGARSA